MRKAIVAVLMVLLVGAAVFLTVRYVSEDVASAGNEVSERAAASLQNKIERIRSADPASADAEIAPPPSTGSDAPEPPPATPAPEPAPEEDTRPLETVEVSEEELEAYVVLFMREHIPAQLDAMDVQLTKGAVAADTQLTFTSNSTGNPIIDALIGGTHNLFVKGKLVGENRQGRFELEEVRVDGIPVPNVLVETLFDKYVKPDYPQADLRAPFELPWGIDSLSLDQGRATIVY